MADSPRKRAWRNTGTPQPASPPVEAAWRSPQAPLRQGPAWWKSRRVQLGFVLAAALGVAATIIAVVLWWNPLKPFTLVVISADYQDNLFVPPNVAGRNGVDHLTKKTDWNPKTTPLDGHFENIDQAVLRKDAEKIVLFVTAHGVARLENGVLVPYLVPQDTDLRNDAPLYKLDRLLGKLPEKTPKLLLLDVSSVAAHWPLGQLHNDFARALKSPALSIDGIKNLVVISSSDEDQRSWTSPEWGQSYFAHFVIEGLNGAADQESEGGDGNGRVDALELFHYVHNNVKRWVWHTRERVQTPIKFGDDQRAKSMVLLTCGNYRAQEEKAKKDHKDNKDYKDLQDAWEKCWKLRRTMPHPAAHAPQLWRRYLDVLLRAEQLWLAGDVGAAKKQLNDLSDLENSIVRSRAIDLEMKSAPLTLAMPEALGLPWNGSQILPPEVIAYVQKPDAAKKGDKEKVIAALKKLAAEDPRRRQMAGAALTDAVFRKVADDPKQALDQGRELLKLIDSKAPDCRSAEVHYLMMLTDNPALWRSNGEANWRLVQQSLLLRRSAEQAALGLGQEKDGERLPAYSEQVLPWIQKMIEDADQPRRLGQDLLFASSTADWDEAKKLLNDNARPAYEKAQAIAVKIRRALYVRDRLYAELPYYTHWIAERGSEHEKVVVELWNELHELRRLLGKPTPGDAALVARLDELQRHLTKGFEQIQNWLEESAANKENPSQQKRWHDIEAVLAVPFLEPQTRMNLIHSSRGISLALFNEPSKESNVEFPNTENYHKLAQASALREGRLALAMLGEDDWRDEYKQVKNALELAEVGAWYRSAARAGQAIGRFLNWLPEMADQKCEEAAHKDLHEAAGLLQTAARYARTIEGAAVLKRMTRNPIDEQRRLRLHDLLCWQAHRTFLDWWAELGQTPQMTPYFQRAGDLFLKDAEQLAMMGQSTKTNAAARSPRLKRVDAEYANLKSAPMVVERSQRGSREDFRPGNAKFYLTDEDKVEWWYRLMGPKEKVPGRPVVQIRADRGLRVAAADASRRPMAFDEPFRVKIAENYSAGRPADGVAKHYVEGFFRGHTAPLATTVYMPVKPDRVVSLPLLTGRGHVAVQTEKSLYELYGADHTAVALLLDCSGSMEPKPIPNSRFKRAVRALRTVLNQLPPGVMVSLRTFGAYQHQEKDPDPKKYGIELVRSSAPWHRDKLDSLMNEVSELKPHGYTPLVRSIAEAKKDLPDDKKARSIVVITDGGDSEFYKDDNRRKGDTIKRFLRRQFADSDIQISVIGFEAKELPPEEREGDKEFRDALQDKDIGGKYYDADNTDLLAEYLARSLLHMYFRVDPDGRDADDREDKGENISPRDKPWRWVDLGSAIYQIRVPSVRSLKQRIDLRSGDALLLDVVRGLGGRPEFHRSLYAESHPIADVHRGKWMDKSQKDWLLAVLQNHQLDGSKKLQLMATLEKRPNPKLSPVSIPQVHPKWVWFDVAAPAGANAAPTLRISSLPDYPADAWGLDLPEWPRDRPAATLKAWWIEHPPQPRAQLFKGPDFRTPLDLHTRTWLTDPQLGDVVLESVGLEKLDLQVEGRSTKRDVNCLVVRLSYPADKEPFFVRLPNNADRKIGVEDRFYTRAGKYTGVFWPMTETDLQNIARLELFSVAALKKENACLSIDKLELPAPDDRFIRPLAVGGNNEEP